MSPDAFAPEPEVEPLPPVPTDGRTLVACVRTSAEWEVYVGRAMEGASDYTRRPPLPGLAPGYFGNPHKARRKGEAVVKFRAYFMARLHDDAEYRANVLALRGKVLGCWCEHPTPETCHAAVMAEWLNEENT